MKRAGSNGTSGRALQARRRQMHAERQSPGSRLIDYTTEALGHPLAVTLAATLVVLWLAFGPLFGFSNTYQLIINTTTTIITFVMVFAIQHTANRETRAINLKLDELLKAVHGASDRLVGVETRSEATIKRLQAEELARAEHVRAKRRRGGNGSRDAA